MFQFSSEQFRVKVGHFEPSPAMVCEEYLAADERR